MNTNDEQAPYCNPCHTHNLGYSDPLPGLPEKCASEGPDAQTGMSNEFPCADDIDKPTERAPMLTRYSLYLDEPDTFVDMEHGEYVKWEDVQAKITSGELMVVKKARFVLPEKHTDYGYCSECKKPVDMSKQPVPFFHTCGAEIVK